MFERIKLLTLLQLGGRKKRMVHTKKQLLVNVLLKLLTIAIVTLIMYFLFNFVKSAFSFPINKGVLTFVLFVSQYISILTCTSSLMSILYNSKDNSILLSYPAKPNEVFISKLVVAYLGEFNKNLYVLFPLFISFGFLNSVEVFYFISSLIMLIILPIFPVFVGALLSIPLSYIKKLFKKFPVLYVILIIGLIIGVYFLLSALVAAIPKPLRLLAIYNKFINGFLTFITSANKFGLFYIFVTDIMYSINVALNSLWLILIAVGVILLTNFISMPLYFNLASKSNERADKSKTLKAKLAKQNPTLLAFVNKELKLTFRNINKVINDYMLIIMMPIVLFIMNAAFSAITVTTLGETMITGLNIIVGMVLVSACNTQSATAITVEGSEFVLLKTAPSKTSNMVWAKILINFIISTIFIVFSSLLMTISSVITIAHIWPICAVMILINWSHILMSFQYDLLNPKLRDYAESGKIDNNPNANKSVISGLLLGILIGAIVIFLLYEDLSLGWYKIVSIALGFFIFRLFLFVKNLRVFFKRIEY